ncbi:hypothetical protein GQ597_10860 [Gilliamella sp. Pra-s65]|uniref:hypothetical protein n=1 Tax=unclassified Gilliamella TaxID=2685620 RepID=UPI001366096A|nr:MULTISPECIES: hypothetical protein [unclassified Gilliamella]MWN91203.1 hypothetical protein [Gilliamella sp. Pra-s65]MWP74189.1 hypothetical protein [Gilliamella sp. Pra-s52]
MFFLNCKIQCNSPTNRHPSTISHEIKRNSKPNQSYQAHETVTLAQKRRKGKAYRHCKTPSIKEGDRRYKRPIKQRPSYVENWKTRGHWESDTMISRKDKQALVTLVEGKTGLVLIGRLNQRTASETRDMIIKLLTPFKKGLKAHL